MSPACRRLDGGRRPGSRSELCDELGQGLRPARIADHHVVVVCHRKSCDLASDVPGSNQSDGRHGSGLLASGSLEAAPQNGAGRT